MKELTNEIKEILKEMATVSYVKPQAKLIGLVAAIGLITGSCTAWVYKDRHQDLTSMQAMPLVSTKQEPLKVTSKSKASIRSACSYTSERPLTTFKVESKKGFKKRALLVMGASTAEEPVIYIRNIKSPHQYKCMKGFNEKVGKFNKLTETVYLKDGAYELFIGTQKKDQWTSQQVDILVM